MDEIQLFIGAGAGAGGKKIPGAGVGRKRTGSATQPVHYSWYKEVLVPIKINKI